MSTTFKIIIGIVALILVIQLVPVEKTNPKVISSEDFVIVNDTPAPIKEMLVRACYDCHSNETKYPAYASIAPISWAIKRHVNDGRKFLNFSVWTKYNTDIQNGAIEKTISSIEGKSMPLASYINYHPEAVLTLEEREMLAGYFKTLQQQRKAKDSIK